MESNESPEIPNRGETLHIPGLPSGDSTPEPASIVCNNKQGDLFYFAGPHRNRFLATAHIGTTRRGFGTNAGEWTGRVQISKEEIPGNRRGMQGYILNYTRLKKNH